jgi:hypothetical protein
MRPAQNSLSQWTLPLALAAPGPLASVARPPALVALVREEHPRSASLWQRALRR